mmetsp:Transcript_5430/g.9448  ORF Transcript_5430/g.9448 Transcript_5430/m.9448 type:complete len:358 (+) Transcript_5430:95-1168(+)
MGSKGSREETASVPTVLEDKYYPEWIKSAENMKDLTGRVALITGVSSSSGLGFYVTKALASKGAECVVTVRNTEKGAAVKAELEEKLKEEGTTAKHITVMKMDNCDFASVRSFTDDFKKKYTRLDIVCNNAGIMGMPYEMSKDGYEVQIQTNHLSHFLMTARLWPLIKTTSEKYGEVALCQVSSGASHMGKPTVDAANLNNEHPPHGLLLYMAPYALGGPTATWARYGQSKLANVMFAVEMNRRIEAAGLAGKIKSTAAHPGLAATNLQITTQNQGGMKDGAKFQKQGQSCADGSLPLIMSVAHPTLVEGGAYYGPREGRTGPPIKTTNENPLSYNADATKALWEASEKAVGEKFEL